MKTHQTPPTAKPLARPACSVDEIAKRIASEILTVSASGGPVHCTRAVMMKGSYPDGERDMGGRNAASIAFVVREHLMAACYPPNHKLSHGGEQ